MVGVRFSHPLLEKDLRTFVFKSFFYLCIGGIMRKKKNRGRDMERSKVIKSIQSLEKTENVVKYELIDTVSENRIQNAIQCYAPTCKREEIVAMVDTTLRKNGKKGDIGNHHRKGAAT